MVLLPTPNGVPLAGRIIILKPVAIECILTNPLVTMGAVCEYIPQLKQAGEVVEAYPANGAMFDNVYVLVVAPV